MGFTACNKLLQAVTTCYNHPWDWLPLALLLPRWQDLSLWRLILESTLAKKSYYPTQLMRSERRFPVTTGFSTFPGALLPVATPHSSLSIPTHSYHIRALAGAVMCAALLWGHYLRQPAGARWLDDSDPAAPDAPTSQYLLALVEFFALLAQSGRPLAADASYTERRLAASRQALEEASFALFPQQHRAFPDNFFQYVDGHVAKPLADRAQMEAPPEVTTQRVSVAPLATSHDGQLIFGVPSRFAEAAQQLVRAAMVRGASILYHDAFPVQIGRASCRERVCESV